jgi:molybdenum-dependent DNA-binding transcriptional regulator ModE
MPAIWQVNALNEPLLGEQVEEAEDGGAANAKATLTRIGDEVGRREVTVTLGNERRNLTARTGKADPRLV